MDNIFSKQCVVVNLVSGAGAYFGKDHLKNVTKVNLVASYTLPAMNNEKFELRSSSVTLNFVYKIQTGHLYLPISRKSVTKLGT